MDRPLNELNPRTRWLGRRLDVHRCVDSTNRIAEKLSRTGAPEGTLVLADEQTAGRGRLGRSFFSPGGRSIYLSALLRPREAPETVHRYIFVAAVSVASAVRAFVPPQLDVSIKWPNDVLIEGRKTSGINLPARVEAGRVVSAVLGIGVNVNVREEEFPPELKGLATSLRIAAGAPVDRVGFAHALIEELERGIDRFRSEGFDPVLEAWRKFSRMQGLRVRVGGPGVRREVEGTVEGVDSDGALLLRTDRGTERVLAGDVTLVEATEVAVLLLAIDIGNTNVVLGLFEGPELVHHWRIGTRRHATSDECAVQLRSLFDVAGLDARGTQNAIVSCVVPPLLPIFERTCTKLFEHEPLVVSPGVRTGMPIRVDNPREVGADRIVNSVAAYELLGGPTVVIDFGTATSFDCVSAAGEFIGGAIVPGILVSLEGLVARASKLSSVEIEVPPGVIGKNTTHSLQSGVVYGYAGLVDAMVERIRAELGAETRTVATGGLAEVIAQEARTIERVEKHLTLEGLRLIHERNASVRSRDGDGSATDSREET